MASSCEARAAIRTGIAGLAIFPRKVRRTVAGQSAIRVLATKEVDQTMSSQVAMQPRVTKSQCVGVAPHDKTKVDTQLQESY